MGVGEAVGLGVSCAGDGVGMGGVGVAVNGLPSNAAAPGGDRSGIGVLAAQAVTASATVASETLRAHASGWRFTH